MLIDETVKVRCFSKNKKHLLSKGYNYIHGEFIEVNVKDLPEKSRSEIMVQCDYCAKKFKTTVHNFNSGKSIINKDACTKCRGIKTKESNLIVYGVESVAHLNSTQEKRKQKLIKHDLDSIVKTVEDNHCSFVKLDGEIGTRSQVYFICNIHNTYVQNKRYDSILEYGCCKECNYIKLGEKMRGENSPNWLGGKTTIQHMIRNDLNEWKFKVLKEYNFKCVLTNDTKDLEIHHLYGFNKILDDVVLELNLDINNLSVEERQLLKDRVLDIHKNVSIGVPLRKDVHQRFHSIYGKGNNTPEQFEEFKQNYIN